jgi:Ca2+-binding RTX toxin-like protein
VLADGQFDATINNLSTGDIIDLTGIGLATSATLDANNVLTIAGGSSGPITLQLDPLQDFSGRVFQLTSDGAGGTNVMLASMSEINNTGIIVGADFGILITVGAQDPGASLTIINSGTIEGGVDGVLVNADPSNLTATGTFVIDNSGVIESTGSGHAINFDLSVSSPGSITIINRETGNLTAAAAGVAIVIAGDSADAITNKGIITGGISTGGGADTFNLFTGSSVSGVIDSGLGNDTINLHGSGQGTLQSFVNVEVVNLHGGDWVLASEDVASVNFQDGLQTLSLDSAVLADGQFDGTISNFATGDIIDLTGIGLATSATLDANNVLTIAGGSSGPITLQLDPLQDFSGLTFQLSSDGAGGTSITLVPAGGGGNGVFAGTAGDDVISTGSGNDIVNSRDGNDQVFGQNGNDVIYTGDGNSLLDGANGNDGLTAGNGHNTLSGGNGNDVLTAGNGNNTLSGGNGNDTLTVGNGDNNLGGGNGNDTFYVGTGNNFLSGGNGSDTFMFGPDFGENVISDFGNNDQIQFSGVFADFQALLDASQQVGNDTIISLDDGQSITLVGVSVNSLHASDFLFT